MISKTELLLQNKELVKQVTEFFLAQDLNKKLFEEIVETLTDEKKQDTENNRIKLGMFTPMYFLNFMSQTGRIEGGVNMGLVKITLETMEERLLLKRADFVVQGAKIYESNHLYVQLLDKLDLIENILLGFEFIINKYRKSVFKIENTDENGKKDIGTGFLHMHNQDKLVITNQHLLEKAIEIKLFDVDDNELEFELLHSNPDTDIA